MALGVLWLSLASLLAPRASAAPGIGALVIETYRGSRAPEVARPLRILLEELSHLGWTALAPEIRERLGIRLAMPGVADVKPRVSLAAIHRQLDIAISKWVNGAGALADTATALAAAIEDALASPALIAADPARRDKLQRAMLYLALAYDALARDPSVTSPAQATEYARLSTSWMEEMIRTYPQEVITQNPHGPLAVQLYRVVRDALDKRGRGTLLVKCSDPDVQLYVDEVIRQLGKPLADLVPGTYRVLVVDANNTSRRYQVEVLPGQSSELVVDWGVDSALQVQASTISLAVPPSAPAGREIELARRLAMNGGGMQAVVVVALGTEGRRLKLTAALYNAISGTRLRSGGVLLGKGEDTRVRALAKFLRNGTEHPDILEPNLVDPNREVRFAATQRAPQPKVFGALFPAGWQPVRAAERPAHPYRRWVAGGVAIAATLGATVLYALDGRERSCADTLPDTCPGPHETTVQAYAATTLAIGAGAFSAYWFTHDRAPRGLAVTAAPVRHGIGVAAALRF